LAGIADTMDQNADLATERLVALGVDVLAGLPSAFAKLGVALPGILS